MDLSEHRISHNRAFAHHYLRDAVFQLAGLLDILTGPNGDDTLSGMWGRCGEQLEEGERASSLGLKKLPTGTLGGRSLITIQMPPPDELADAHLVVIAYEVRRKRWPFAKDRWSIRYFTLEMSIDNDIIGEWTYEDGKPKHWNYGPGPEPTPEAFVAALNPYLDDTDRRSRAWATTSFG